MSLPSHTMLPNGDIWLGSNRPERPDNVNIPLGQDPVGDAVVDVLKEAIAGETDAECPYCGMTFSTPQLFASHVESQHAGTLASSAAQQREEELEFLRSGAMGPALQMAAIETPAEIIQESVAQAEANAKE